MGEPNNNKRFVQTLFAGLGSNDKEEINEFVYDQIKKMGFAKPDPFGGEPFYVLKPKGEDLGERVHVPASKVKRALEINPDWEFA